MSAPTVLPWGSPSPIRARGDRRGFEPRRGTLTPPAPQVSKAMFGRDQLGYTWDGQPVGRLGVWLDGGIGDHLRTLPLIRGALMSSKAREVVVMVLAGQANRAELLRCVPLDWPVTVRWLSNATKVEPPEDLGVDAWLMSIHIQALMMWPPSRVGPLRAPLVDLVARGLGLSLRHCAGELLRLPAEARAAARARVPGVPTVVVQIDGPVTLNGEGVGIREYAVFRHAKNPVPALVSLARQLRRKGVRVIAVGAPGGPQLPRGTLDLRGASLVETAAIIEAADLFVGPDSGPLHMAGVVGTPALGLYGPSDPWVHVVAAGTVPVMSRRCAAAPCGEAHPYGALVTMTAEGSRYVLPCAYSTSPEDLGGCMAWSGRELADLAEAILDARGGDLTMLPVALRHRHPDPAFMSRMRAGVEATRSG